MLLRSEPVDGVLSLRLNRPLRLNALTLELAQALHAAVLEASADDAVRVILLEGEGRAFCAGKDRDDPATSEFVLSLQQLATALMECPKPVVAAVQGWAVGGGLELLLNCDIVLAARSARFMLPEVGVGLLGTGGVHALLPRKLGLAKAKGILMLGGEFTAVQAEQWGLIWSVVDDASLETEARIAANKLATSDPFILATMKSLLHTEALADFDQVLAREAKAHQGLAGLSRSQSLRDARA